MTVCCVWVRGHVPFSAEYPKRLALMVRRFMDRPYTFVCFTDRPHLLRGMDIETVRISAPPRGVYGWWSKVQLFNPALPIRGRMLYLDLDTLVVSGLQPIVDFPSMFALVPDAGRWNGARGRKVVKRFNSSVMVWDAGVNGYLYQQWDRTVARRLWGDQDWIGEQCPGADTMPLKWFPRMSECPGGPPLESRVVLCKKPKNLQAAQEYPWVREAWG